MRVVSVIFDDGEFLTKKKKKKKKKRQGNVRSSCREVAANLKSILAVNRGNVIVTFSFREKISEQTYDSRVPNILAIIHIENHWYVRIKEIQFPSTFVENITGMKKKRKKSLLKLLNIRDFENISRSRLRKIDLIRMHKYIGRIKVSRVIFPFVSFSLPECKLPSQIRFGIDAKYPFETFTCTIWFPKTRSRGGGPRGKFVNPNRRGRKAIKRN